MASNNVLDLTPTEDQFIVVKKYGTTISFPDRLPATLVPTLMRMTQETGDLEQQSENMVRMTQILARLINRSNPDIEIDWLMDWLDIQDVPVLVSRLLNPPAQSTPTNSEPETMDPSSVPATTKKPRKS